MLSVSEACGQNKSGFCCSLAPGYGEGEACILWEWMLPSNSATQREGSRNEIRMFPWKCPSCSASSDGVCQLWPPECERISYQSTTSSIPSLLPACEPCCCLGMPSIAAPVEATGSELSWQRQAEGCDCQRTK